MHQYSSTPWDTRTYDATGVLASKVQSDGSVGAPFTYDALGQLAHYGDTRGSLLLADNFNNGDYDGWRLAEQCAPDGTVLADYAYGNGLDELLHTRWPGFDLDFYYLQDDQGSVVALADGDGDVVNRYGYGPGGEPVAYDALGQPRSNGFTSRQLFAERRTSGLSSH